MNQPSDEILSKTFATEETAQKFYTCAVCGYRYHEHKISFEALPEDWQCPVCRTEKSVFRLV